MSLSPQTAVAVHELLFSIAPPCCIPTVLPSLTQKIKDPNLSQNNEPVPHFGPINRAKTGIES